eukprot:9490988-Pyramimonas_sp.AAC.1
MLYVTSASGSKCAFCFSSAGLKCADRRCHLRIFPRLPVAINAREKCADARTRGAKRADAHFL